MLAKSKGTTLTSLANKPNKKQQLQPEIDNENVSKTRASRYGRHCRSKLLPKTETETFQIRKALSLYVREKLAEQGRKTYFQRVFILARNTELAKIQEISKDLFYGTKPHDYRESFQRQINKIFRICDNKKCITDHLTGLFICMDTHTYLMIEGAEDMIADFFEQLSVIHDDLWTASKVFLVEDKIGETYFNSFHTLRSPAININEKFPNSTVTDYDLMSAQHFKIMEKVQKIAQSLSKQLLEADSNRGCMTDSYNLPADPYNKLLPEIQRIDLVLNANKFYRNVKDYALTYHIIPTHQDEDALFWPIQDNYTALGVFERSEFDVNLTFNDYGKEEKKDSELIHKNY